MGGRQRKSDGEYLICPLTADGKFDATGYMSTPRVVPLHYHLQNALKYLSCRWFS
jgi:hypothetical protein